jgi:hypothetical protein
MTCRRATGIRRYATVLTAGFAAALGLAAVAACGSNASGRPPECSLRPGDLVITEIFAEAVGSDEGKEWFEIYNASGRELDLRGLRVIFEYGELGKTQKRHTIDGDTPVTLAAGMYGAISSAVTPLPGDVWAYGVFLGCEAGCVDECDADETGCIDDRTPFVCGEAGDGDTCRERLPQTVCAAGQACVAGACQAGCVDECTLDARGCHEDGTPWVCGEAGDGDACSERLPQAACAAGQACLDGDCIVGCVDECDPGERGCLDARTPWLCGEADGDPCRDRVAQATCGAAEVCVGKSRNLLAAMPAKGLRIGLVCGDGTLIDSVCFGQPCGASDFAFPEGRSWTYQSAAAPDHLANDEADRWQATRPTRGAPNPPPCLCPQPPEGVVPQAPGEDTLRITEVFPNPAGPDTGFEWFEFYVDGTGWFDLTGVRFTTNAEAAKSGLVLSRATGCVLFEGGRHYLVAGEYAIEGPPTTTPSDGTPDEADAGSTAAPDAASGDVADGLPAEEEDACPRLGGLRVHQVTSKVTLGNASGDGSRLAIWSPRGQLWDVLLYKSVIENRAVQRLFDEDGAETVCVAQKPYETSWAAPWTLFGTPGAPNPPCGACFCADVLGTVIEAQSPAPGEIVITEVLPDVLGSESEFAAREWFEAHLLPTAEGGRDLACVRLRKKATDKDVALVNANHGCLRFPEDAWILFGVSTDPDLNGGLPRVDVQYPKLGTGLTGDDGTLGLYLPDGTLLDEVSWGKSDDGIARQLDADLLEDDPVADNDLTSSWCNAFVGYGDEAGQRGTPGQPNFSCTRCYCFDEDDEEWLEAPPPAAGELRITEVFGNTPGAEQATLEWLEVESLTPATRYLNCVSLFVDGARRPEIGLANPTCRPIPRDARLVLCADRAAALSHGISDCVAYSSRAFKNTDVIGIASRTDLIDSVTYTNLADGVSWMLGAGGTFCQTPSSSCYFDCQSSNPFIGTPGAPNPACAP